jgi:putative peptidoglycan lipid II flippase
MGSLAQAGLALATSIGAWLNLALVVWFAVRRDLFGFTPALRNAVTKLLAAGLALAIALWLALGPVARLFAWWPSWREESTLAVLAVIGAVVYGGIVLTLFGPRWLSALRARKRLAGPPPPPMPPMPPPD